MISRFVCCVTGKTTAALNRLSVAVLQHLGPVAPTKLKFKYHLNPEIIVN